MMADTAAGSDPDLSATLLHFLEEVHELNDVDAILDRILGHARAFSGADAGSIFLNEGDHLRFSYVHNDTLFETGGNNEALYADYTVPIDESSIVGYAAKTGRDINIEDAYRLPPGLPYRFNQSYDRESGYRTRSILTVPLKSSRGRLSGVIQLINARDETGRTVAFGDSARRYVALLGRDAAIAIERGIMNREIALRMMKMAEMRDPEETGAHVQRVGAYSAELFKRWLKNYRAAHGYLPSMAPQTPGDVEPPTAADSQIQVLRKADMLRLASMLHDVGKVGVPDAILKKPGRLTAEEFDAMKLHTVGGARLFANAGSELDRMCFDIALHHHEKWNGKGYPGMVGDLEGTDLSPAAPPLSGASIPLVARITALADVYDALSSRRSYKEGWPEEKVLGIIEEESGQHFDPDLVKAFFEIHPVMLAIKNKYR